MYVRVCMEVYVWKCVCTYARMHVCMCVWMCGYVDVSIHVQYSVLYDRMAVCVMCSSVTWMVDCGQESMGSTWQPCEWQGVEQ
jgi:hypothetical protein